MSFADEPIPYLSEDDWHACRDPERMMLFLGFHWRQSLPRWLRPARTSSRKLRLLACACERLNPALNDAKRRDIDLAERFADGKASKGELKAARLAHGELWHFDGLAALFPHACHAAYHGVLRTSGDAALALVRDVFGNPYRPVQAEPSWLAHDVVALARVIYADRAFGRLPELAAVLEQAGCTNANVVAHCREGGHHARGCWAVDLVLGRT